MLIFINMKYIITESKLNSVFNSIMEEYSNLEKYERSYDWWNYELGRYTDFNVYNFYVDAELDYENDEWILQYQTEPGDFGTKEELPILRYGINWPFNNVINLFGEKTFNSHLKNWFEETYKLPVKTVSNTDIY